MAEGRDFQLLNVRNSIYNFRQMLSARATQQASWRDLRLAEDSASPDRHLYEAIRWLCRAHEATKRNGVSYGYDLKQGWLPAYPETTGYIICTLLKYAENSDESTILREHTRQMADWLITVQMECGALPGGTISSVPAPTVFNTGQVLQGWCDAYREFQDENIRKALVRAATWLVAVQDDDGCWRRFMSTKTIVQTPAVYNVRSALALLQAGELLDDTNFRNAAIKNFDWALSQQHDNGWFANNCLTDINNPLTHTIGYTLEGFVEAARILDSDRYRSAVLLASKSLRPGVRDDGFLNGRFDAQWRPHVTWNCLTGACQIAIVWYKLSEIVNDKEYAAMADRLMSFVKRTQKLPEENSNGKTVNINGDGISGGIKGSHPIWGGYDPFRYLNWAAKFFADALLAGGVN